MKEHVTEVEQQQRDLYRIAARHGGMKAGGENGRRGYQLTYSIAYIRDFLMNYYIIAESFETSVPWSKALALCENVKRRLQDEYKARQLPGKPFVTARVTQVYRTGVCIYFYFGFYYKGIPNPQEVYLELENIARDEILNSGGSFSHHHGVGKLRRAYLPRIMSETAIQWKRELKKSLDPQNVFRRRQSGSGQSMKWAIITGASSGIGRALAFEFAADQFDLLLTGRNEDELKKVAAECSLKHSVQTEIVVADLSCAGDIDRLVQTVSSKTYSYEALVNNAGFAIHGDFSSTDIDENIRLLHVQLTAALRLTRAVLPGMIEHRRGRVLNVVSYIRLPWFLYQSVYAVVSVSPVLFSIFAERSQRKGCQRDGILPGITQTNGPYRAAGSGMSGSSAARIAFRAQCVENATCRDPGMASRAFVFVAPVIPPHSMAALARFINRQRVE